MQDSFPTLAYHSGVIESMYKLSFIVISKDLKILQLKKQANGSQHCNKIFSKIASFSNAVGCLTSHDHAVSGLLGSSR